MRLLVLSVVAVAIVLPGIVCPPVKEVKAKPVEGGSEDEEVNTGLEYDRYLREVVMALEEDEGFKKKLENANVSDIKNGKIAQHLEFVSHNIRSKLDELKRQEIARLKNLARERLRNMNGIQKMDDLYPHHLEVNNVHSFEMADLEKLIKKATEDLDELDKQRKEEFKNYEMEKEHERRGKLEHLPEDQKKIEQEKFEEAQKKHKEHPDVHHPGSKAQLEDVWEKTDHMDSEDFDPKTFFKLHDMDGNGFLDEEEIEALFQKELDKVYDPNMPEDDMMERYEEMNRMREHVFKEVDQDHDGMISQNEFLKYTKGEEFEKDEGWDTLDKQQMFSEDDLTEYERLMQEHEDRMRQQGVDTGDHQPGVVHPPQDSNVQNMGIPQGMPPGGQMGMDPAQQQHLAQQQQQAMQQQQMAQQQHHEQQQQMAHQQQQAQQQQQQQQQHQEQQQHAQQQQQQQLHQEQQQQQQQQQHVQQQQQQHAQQQQQHAQQQQQQPVVPAQAVQQPVQVQIQQGDQQGQMHQGQGQPVQGQVPHQ